MSKRIGNWTYFQHPYNGPVWRLDGTTLDLEHDPQCHSVCIGSDRCNGAWVLYRDGRYDQPVTEHLEAAMEWVEQKHDEERRSALAVESITCDELAGALKELAKRTRNGNAYFPALATNIFEYIEQQRTFKALAGLGGLSRIGFAAGCGDGRKIVASPAIALADQHARVRTVLRHPPPRCSDSRYGYRVVPVRLPRTTARKPGERDQAEEVGAEDEGDNSVVGGHS